LYLTKGKQLVIYFITDKPFSMSSLYSRFSRFLLFMCLLVSQVAFSSPPGATSTTGFTFISGDTTNVPDTARPVIVSFSPTSGQLGTVVTIFGSHFTGATAVRFGSILASSSVVLSDTVIQATVGTGASGFVTVTSPNGTGYKPGFTFIRDTTSIPDTARPVIAAFSPTSARKGTVVTIFGSHFTGATAVRFGSVLASSSVVLSDTVIQAIVGTGASGFVSVTSPKSTGYKPGFTFIRDTTNIPDTTPVITSFTPTSGHQGTIVTIFGKRLTNASAVRFGGVLADTVLLRDTVIIAIVGTGATGNVSVTTPYGTASKPGFIFISDSTIGDTSFVYTLSGAENGRVATSPKSFALYPNPASTYVIWQHPLTEHTTRLQVIDISGRVVQQVIVGKAVSQTTVNVSGLHTGVYKLVWIDGKKKLTRTLLVK
jgi:hypothetical protein